MPLREKAVCCEPVDDGSPGICCSEYQKFFYFSIASVVKSAQVTTNATNIALIATNPAHGMTGWYQVGTYVEYWELYQNNSSGPPTLIATHEVGYDWSHDFLGGQKAVSVLEYSAGDLDPTISPFDERVTPGAGQFYVETTSELRDLSSEVTEADVLSELNSLINAQDWSGFPGPVDTGLVGAGLDYDASSGSAMRMKYRVDGYVDGYPTEDPGDPASIFLAGEEAGTPVALTFNVDYEEAEIIGATSTPASGTLNYYSGSGWWSLADPAPGGVGNMTELPFIRDEQWVARLVDPYDTANYDVAYIAEVWLSSEIGNGPNGQGLYDQTMAIPGFNALEI